MNVAFIGATGWVGSHTISFLKPKFDMTLFAYSAGEVASLPVGTMDICDWDTTASVVSAGTANGVPFDAVVYCATAEYRGIPWGESESERRYSENCIEVNARGAYHIFEAAYRAGVPKVVLIGSLTAVLGAPQYDFITTNTPDRPANIYAATKIFAENVGRTYAYPTPDPNGLTTPMQVICLRLGQPFASEAQWRASRFTGSPVAVSMEDIACAIDKALHSELHYGVYPVVSRVDHTLIDPVLYAELGYEPAWHLSVASDRWIRCDEAHVAV